MARVWIGLVGVMALAGWTAPEAQAAPSKKLGVKIVSATVRGKAIQEAEVSLSREGAAPVTGKTDASGRVTLDNTFGVDDESVLLTVRRPGFSPLEVECPCSGLTYALSETLGQDRPEAIRVVLNWGSDVPYLDLHAVFADQHVYWESREGRDARLDVRAEEQYGPATITVDKRQPGEKYVFAVHNWSAEGKYGNKKLSASRARVFVYVGDSLVRSYKVPTGKVGALWTLFALDDEGAFHDLDQVVDIAELPSLRRYLKQLTERNNFGLPTFVSEEQMAQARGLMAKGDESLQGGRDDEAIRYYMKAVRAWPTNAAGYEKLSAAYARSGRKAEAQFSTRKAAQLKRVSSDKNYRVPNAKIKMEASSNLPPWKHYTFDPQSLIDDNLWTSWQPLRKAPGGVGEWFKLTFSEPQTITGFEVSNGFRLVDDLGDLFKMNNRVKDAIIELSDGTQVPVTFEDAAKETRVLLPAATTVSWVKVTVKSIYKGTKWNDLAVSEFHALGTGQ